MPDKSSTPIPLAVLHRGLEGTKQRCEVDGVSLPSLAVSVRTTGEVDTQSPDSEDVSDTPAEFASGVRARTNVVTGHVSESPRQETAANEVAEKRARRRGLVQMSALCWMMFLIGWNDGSQGPLLPRIQKAYGINFIVVSLAFVGASAGIIIGGLANIYIAQKLSFGKILVAAPLLTICGYAIQAPAPPFPIFVVATGIVGFSVTLQDIHGNNYVAHMQKSSSRLGVLHCAYGVGAFAAPLVATQFAQLHHWSFLYIVSLSIAALNVIVVAFVFRFRSLEDCLLDMGDPPQQTDAEIGNPYSQLIRFKGLYFLSIFILLYVGAEVTIGGWIVTYTIDIRHGGPSAGYISSGFFGGLALGRVLLLPLTKLLGNRLAVLCYVLLAMGLEFIVWFVPSLVSGAVAIAIAGLFLGPIYPVTVQQAGLLFPRGLLNGAISVLAAFATTGGAGLPLAAGLLAQSKGIWSLQPLLVSIMAAMAGLWLVIPKTRSHID